MEQSATNCWDFMHCGQEITGGQGGEALCPAVLCSAANGIHYGHNGGRACWALDGTLCAGKPEQAAEKTAACMACAFFQKVHREETDNLISHDEIRALIYGSTAD